MEYRIYNKNGTKENALEEALASYTSSDVTRTEMNNNYKDFKPFPVFEYKVRETAGIHAGIFFTTFFEVCLPQNYSFFGFYDTLDVHGDAVERAGYTMISTEESDKIAREHLEQLEIYIGKL